MRENAAAKARRYLTDGRLAITRVDPLRVVASCRGDGTIYQLSYRHRMWSCTCPARSPDCAHLLAVRLVVAVDLEVAEARPPPSGTSVAHPSVPVESWPAPGGGPGEGAWARCCDCQHRYMQHTTGGHCRKCRCPAFTPPGAVGDREHQS